MPCDRCENLGYTEYSLTSLDKEQNMSTARIFPSSEFLQPTDGDPHRSVVTESPDAIVGLFRLCRRRLLDIN
jgi:hypothetical protein